MTSLKRSAFAYALVLFFLFVSAHGQTPQVSTVNVTPDERRVRVAAVGDVLDMRVAVSDEAGEVVFESGPVAGDKLDWTMRDPHGQRVPAGTYTMTVTYRAANGKLKRRVEQVLVTEEVAGASAAQDEPTPAAVGTITGQGTTGKIAKFTGANAIGNSVLTESTGRIGLGTSSPQQSLHVLGAQSRLRLQSTGGASLTSTEYLTNNRLWQAGVGGSTAAGGVASKFFVFDQNANQYRLVIDTAGNFGIGTTAPTSRLTVNGMIQILGPATNGIKFADGSIQTKAIAGTINGTGTANRLAKFTGPNSFGNSSVAEVSGKVGIGTAAPLSRLDVRGDLFIGLPSAPDSGPNSNSLFIVNDFGDPRNSFRLDGHENNLYLIARSGANSAAGAGIVFRTAPAASGEHDRMIIMPDGRVGIGASSPTYRLHVEGGSNVAVHGNSTSSFGVWGKSDTSHGVVGSSNSGNAVYGSSDNGFAGFFNGKVQINGNLTVVGNLCSINYPCNSDARLKQDITNLNYGLDQLLRLRPVTWRWKSEPRGDLQMGLVAQEVEKVLPELILKDADATKPLGLNYMALLPVAVKAIQEQQAQIREQQGLIEQQSRQNEEQRLLIERLQARLARVERNMKKKRTAKGR